MRNIGYYATFRVTCYPMIFKTELGRLSEKIPVSRSGSGTVCDLFRPPALWSSQNVLMVATVFDFKDRSSNCIICISVLAFHVPFEAAHSGKLTATAGTKCGTSVNLRVAL